MKELKQYEEEYLEFNLMQMYELLQLQEQIEEKISNMTSAMRVVSMMGMPERLEHNDYAILYTKLKKILKEKYNVISISGSNLAHLLYVMHKSAKLTEAKVCILQDVELDKNNKVII